MVQAVSRDEERSRRHDSVFVEREAELEQMASKMPRSVGTFPYLMEIKTGVVHPWSEGMAERSDLVVGCYNLQGSQNPEDADPNYNPQRAAIRGEQLRKRVETVAPRTISEQKAHDAEVEGRLRRKLEAEHEATLEAERERIRAELLAEMSQTQEPPVEVTHNNMDNNGVVDPAPVVVAPPIEPVVPAKVDKKAGNKGNKGKTDAAPAPVTEPVTPVVQADANTAGNGIDDLDAAFEEAMK